MFDLPHNNRKKNSAGFLLILVVVCGVVFFSPLRHVLHQFVTPFTSYDKGYIFRTQKQFAREREKLIAENEALKSKFALYDVLQKENQELKELLGRVEQDTRIIATVRAQPSRSFYQTLMIDAGLREGIEPGMVVSAFDETEIGVIDSVTPTTALVALYSAPGNEVVGTIVGSSETTVRLIGRGAGEYEVRIPRDLSFDSGMLIITQSTFPRPLAQIEKVITNPRDPFQRILAKTPISIEHIRWVTVRK